MTDLSEDAVEGLWLNISSLEALDDARQAKLVGAIFGGEDGRRYLENLIERAWWDEPDRVEQERESLAVAESKQERPVPRPKDV